jgi:hypothetical protein
MFDALRGRKTRKRFGVTNVRHSTRSGGRQLGYTLSVGCSREYALTYGWEGFDALRGRKIRKRFGVTNVRHSTRSGGRQLGYTLSVDCSGEYALTFVWASLSCLLPVASVAGRQVCREAVAKQQWHWGGWWALNLNLGWALLWANLNLNLGKTAPGPYLSTNFLISCSLDLGQMRRTSPSSTTM